MKNEIAQEIKNINLRDIRLEKRADQIVQRIAERPNESFPKIFSNSAELEAFYRFVENPYVDSDAIFAGHCVATLERCHSVETVLVVHDTTEFSFSGDRKQTLGERGSFFGHCGLAIEYGSNTPLGVLRMHTWIREKGYKSPTSLLKSGLISKEQARNLPSEKDRWLLGVKETASLFSDKKKLIHVADSEGDDYNLLSNLVEQHRFVIRGYENRNLADSGQKLIPTLASAPFICERTVHLGKRVAQRGTKQRNRPRNERTATLSVRCTSVTILRPKAALSYLPATMQLNVIYINELNAPNDTEPVEWILLTNESISDQEAVLRVIDIYRGRWIIEEYFKALKTGCSFEDRQLESYSSLLICLMLLIPISWLMLRMRAQARSSNPVSAQQILPDDFIDVLEAHTGKVINTAQEALSEIAKLGGHIKYNGPPGWLVIWKGFKELASMVHGFILAKSISKHLSTKRCEQS